VQNARVPRIRLVAALTFACAALAPATAANAALETILQDDASLLHRPTEQVRASMQKLRSLGVDRVRLTANWSVLTRDPGSNRKPDGFDARDPAAYPQEQWVGLDDAVRLARASGLKVLIDVGFWGPHWATSDPPGPRARTNIDPKAFADFVVAVARRYSGTWRPVPTVIPAAPPSQDQNQLDGLLGGKPAGGQLPSMIPSEPLPSVGQFVLWNEPNHPSLLLPQWTGRGRRARPASPRIYARMVRAAYPAAKAARPNAAFLLGNTSSDGGRAPRGAVAPLLFIREMACVDARLRPLHTAACRHYKRLPGDGWAHHPYPRQLRPDDVGRPEHRDYARIGNLARLSTLLRRLARRGRIAKRLTQIHMTEFGYETAKIRGRPTVTQATQARWLTWAEYVASKVPGVVSFAQFLLRDLPPGIERVSTSKNRGFGQYYSGLETVAGKDKLAVETFKAGLFAKRQGGRNLLWGRLRLGKGPKMITIERKRRGRPWLVLTSRTVDGQAAFSQQTTDVREALYRLRWPRPDGTIAAGLPVKAVVTRR